MASNPYINKVQFGPMVVMDITDTTATEADVAAGAVFYKASGQRAVGTASGGITLDDVYPVGSIYMSVSSTDPGTLFGGTWQRIQDTFLLAAGTNHAAGSSGGAETHAHTTGDHKLTVGETPVPAHSHPLPNSAIVYNADGVQRLATSGSGTKSSVNTNVGLATASNTAITSNTAHNHGDTGDGSSMPPFLAVYVWKRTA